jgi:hypothetical protein
MVNMKTKGIGILSIDLSKDRALVNYIAKEIERDSCKVCGWTDEQFEIWWHKDKNNHPSNKARCRQYARAALRALQKYAYNEDDMESEYEFEHSGRSLRVGFFDPLIPFMERRKCQENLQKKKR